MYRDTELSLDEHDRAVGAILIGEALLQGLERAAVRNEQPATYQDRWRALTDVSDTYPELWRHLDRARRELARRGISTAGYDRLRPHRRRAATQDDAIDPAALDDARRAVAELKDSVRGADWKAIDVRTERLVRRPLLRARVWLTVGPIVAGFSLAVVWWFVAIRPSHKADPNVVARMEMRKQLRDITSDRKDHIQILTTQIADRCDSHNVHTLLKEMVFDGQVDEARRYAERYTSRCGLDAEVDKWAKAPHPGH
jgi:hypothetical protein